MRGEQRRYSFCYRAETEFDPEVSQHFFKLRALPMSTASCEVVKAELSLEPACSYLTGSDAFGNLLQYGQCLPSHKRFAYTATGEVVCRQYLCSGSDLHPMYSMASPLVPLTGRLRDFAGECLTGFKRHWSNQRRAEYLMNALFERMQYLPGSTDYATRADEAFDQGCGVCQDYAHILISLCRNCAVPARYAAGFLLGEGKTHAFVEIHEHNVWLGLDPTHNRLIDFGCVKTAHGRDAADCSVVRGVYRGFCQERDSVSVSLQEI